MKITLEKLKKLHACQPGIDAFSAKYGQEADLREAVEWCIASGYKTADYALWLLPRLMTHARQVEFAIHAARLVLPLFENNHPDDPRPRQAIEAAESWLKNPTDDSAANAAYAATNAVNAAYAAVNAAYAAANAAYASANAAAYAVVNAAYAAANAVNAAYAAANAVNADNSDVGVNAKVDCLIFGLKLIGERIA